jgi:putative ABC transport system permease protein
MLVGVTLMIGSFRRTVEIWLDGTVRADLYVTSETWSRARGAAALDEAVVGSLSSHPSVEGVDRLRQLFTEVEGRRVSVLGVDMGLRGGASRFALIEGEPEEALLRAAGRGEVLLGEPLARRAGLTIGDRVELVGREGPRSLPVAGVYYDYGSEQGSVAMDLGLLEEVFGPGPLNNLALYLSPGADPEAVRDELLAARPGDALRIRSDRRLREDVMALFDQTFAVSRLLQLMSLVVAASGITLTLLVLARERISELALFRALGARRRQIFRVFLGQGLGLATLGTALGLAGGLLLALILIFLINRSYFGWTIALHWPWALLAEEVVLILAAALLASLYPALRASRTPASELSREDL